MLVVRFLREGGDVIADGAGVVFEFRFADLVVFSLDGVEVGFKGHLGVDDHLAPTGEFDDQIGSKATLISCRLLEEVAMVEHPGHFDDSAQLDFSPTTAR